MSIHDTRYHSVSILLHWLMAVGFFLMLGSGVAMEYIELEKSLKFQLYQWHKSGGVLLLISGIARLAWRVFSHIPALPAAFSPAEQKAAKAGHWGLYFCMIAMPLTGWLMVSSSVYGLPTIVFGWFEWPHIPGIQGDESIEALAKDAHYILAITFGVMIIIHIAAVIKHYAKDNINLLTRMWWQKGDSA